MKKNKIKKELYIEILRIIAIVFVIFNHTDGYFLYYSNTENPMTWCFSFMGSVLCRSNVPLFLMITGAVLLGKKESISHLFKNRISRIVVVLAVFSLFYYILNICRSPGKSFSVTEFLIGILEGSIQDSFWYLYLYLGLLVLLPFLRKIAVSCSNRELQYLLCIQFIMGTGGGIFSFVTEIELNGYLYLLNDYIFYLMAGYYLGQRIEIDRIKKSWAIGSGVTIILCLLGTFVFASLDYWRNGTYNQGELDLLAAVLSISIFFEVRWFCQKHAFLSRIRNVTYEAGNCVFGIYLLEQVSRMQLMPLYLYLSENTIGVLACSCYVISSFVLAWFYTEILKHIPGMKRLV